MWTCPILQPLFQLMSTLQKMGKWKRKYFWLRGKISRLKTRFNSPLKAQIVTLVSSHFISFDSQNLEVGGKKLIFKKNLKLSNRKESLLATCKDISAQNEIQFTIEGTNCNSGKFKFYFV